MKFRLKYTVLYSLIVLSLISSFFTVKFPDIPTASSIALYFSALFGYSGIVLLLWSFILGTRSVISIFFNDFTKIAKIHSWLGKYGIALFIAHPILISISYSQSLLSMMWPDFSSEFTNAINYGKSALWIIIIIWISSAVMKTRVSYRPWKYIHLGAYLSIPFVLLHIPLTGSNYATSLSTRIYFFTILISFMVFLILRLRGALNLNKIQFLISEQWQEKDEIYVLRLLPTNKLKFNPKPGQYVYIKYGWLSEDHPFSILDYNNKTGELLISYKVYGLFTKRLAKLKTGNKLFISGPFGDFTQDINDHAVVYIAGGIGITPFIQRITNEKNKREQWLFYTNRSHNSAAFLQSIQQTMDSRCIAIFSREPQTNIQNCEYGHIDSTTFTKYLDNPQRFIYYICGPQTMVSSVISNLKKLHIPTNNIHSELFNL